MTVKTLKTFARRVRNVFWQSLACFVLGGIITVIFIKILEWQRDQNNEEQEDKRILVPVQEVGDGEREEPWKVESFHENKTTFKVLMRGIITFNVIF